MKTKQKKALAFLLCAALVLALCPAALAEGETPTESPVVEPTATPETPASDSVARVGETEYSSLKEAITNAGDGGTVILLNDVTLSEYMLVQGKSFKLDMQGHKISGNTVYIYPDCDVEISNGTFEWDNDYPALMVRGATADLTNVTVKASGTYALQVGYNNKNAEEKTTDVTLNNCTVGGAQVGVFIAGPYYNVMPNETQTSRAKLTVNDSDISGLAAIQGNGTYHGTEITINSGSLSSPNGCGIYHPQYGVLNINGGTVSGSTGIEIRAGELNMTGGKVSGTGAPTEIQPNGSGSTVDGAGIGISQHTTKLPLTVSISGGEVSGHTAVYQANVEGNDEEAVAKVSLSISGGEFTAVNNGSNAVYSQNKTGFISGGTFSSNADSSYLLPGNTLVRNDDGMYTFGVADNAVAEVGGKGYTSLADAIEAAKNGGTVKLRNAASDVTIPAGTSVTIDLNGQTISSNADHAITNNGTLTIIGSGTVDGKDTSGKGALYNAPGATANLNGGTFTGSKWYVIKNLGTMTIDGASVVQNDIISSAIDSGYFGNLTNDCGVTYPSSATVTLNITSGSVTGGVNCVKNDDFGILNISGGSFSTTAPDGAVIMNWNKATISGGTFVGDGTAAVISNGYLSDTADKGELTITNGTFTSTNNGKLFGTGSTTAGAKTTISGGTFTGQLNKISTTTVSISGGTYSVEVPDEFCAPGYHPEELENGRYGVSDTYHTGTTGSGLVSGGIVIGTGTNTGTVTDPSLLPPQTGDASVVGIAAALLLLASCGMAGLALRRSAKKREMN